MVGSAASLARRRRSPCRWPCRAAARTAPSPGACSIAILEDGRLAIEAITGTSAGSVNAVVLAEGWLEGGADGAREQLAKFWQRVSLDGGLAPAQRRCSTCSSAIWHADGSPARLWLDAWTSALSPYEMNPLDINPLRDALRELIDFERVRSCANDEALHLRHQRAGPARSRIFERAELTADHVLASACLPTIFPGGGDRRRALLGRRLCRQPAAVPAVLRDREPTTSCWCRSTRSSAATTPRTAREIANRLTEITFNANLLGELRAIEFVTA